MSNDWTALTEDQQHQLARLVRPQSSEHPAELIAAVASTVITEPGDSVWGECVAAATASGALSALIQAADVTEFARAIDLPVDADLTAGWARWMPRLNQRAAVAAIEHAARLGARVLLPGDADWPDGLYDLGPHMPQALYVRGGTALPWPRSIAVVGARAATGYGEHVAAELSGELAASGVMIVSGAAYGIDGVAHRAALAESQPTVAFLAGGIDRFYPSGHIDLLRRIAHSGLVVSETPCGTSPSKWRFLQRNRLIAAASQATVVVEAGARSGSLNTAAHAATLGRPIGAVPGSITSASSTGCHLLLREFAAVCVTSAADVRELVFPVGAPDTDERRVSAESVRLHDALTSTARSVDQIAAKAGLSVAMVSGLLAEAELTGAARNTPLGWVRGVLR